MKFQRSWVSAFSALLLVSAPSVAAEQAQRLSEWLLTHPAQADDYPLGLLWKVPGEIPAQQKKRRELLQLLADAGESSSQNFAKWLASLPVTGRVTVAAADAEWLLVNAKRDPLILPTHEVILPKRPRSVTLLSSTGERCQVTHRAGARVQDYLASCVFSPSAAIDWAWIVQPDGKVLHFGLANWNEQQALEPAPGAWVWLPNRQHAWAEEIAEPLANFLATQGVAADMTAPIRPQPAQMSRSQVALPMMTGNDWGEVGLLQTPSARMREVGNVSVTMSKAQPYTNLNVFAQPFAWLEAGFRYTDISNRLYGASIAGTQSYKDKSMDLKLGLWDESAYLPQLAVGARDITGTGLFSGEYVVANKRSGAWDWSLGLGWGYLGGRGNLNNPFNVISQSFSTRVMDANKSGNFSVKSYFRGPVSAFGGVQYQTAWEPLLLKLEYDGNDYQHVQPFGDSLSQASPWNIGAVYQVGNGLNLMLGYERGNTLMLGFTLQTDIRKVAMPKLDDPAPLPVALTSPENSALSATSAKELSEQTGWQVRAITQNAHVLQVEIEQAGAFYWQQKLERANAVLHRDSGAEIDSFHYINRQHGMLVAEVTVERAAWVRQQTQALPESQIVAPNVIQPIDLIDKNKNPAQTVFQQTPTLFEADPGLRWIYNLGGPNGFLLYQIAAEANTKLNLSDNWWVQGRVSLDLIDNYNGFVYDAPSNMPRVRTYMREYLTTSKVTMPLLQMTHSGKLTDNQYYSVYGGYLETMYAGVGAEWMYRALGSPFALGVDVNQVQQRDFSQNFAFRDYQTSTGHVTLYWDTGFNDVMASVSGGRYLAGDSGYTFDLSRVFRNGMRMGGYFTKTNVPAVIFGEGSFDKGMYLTIPFDAMLTQSSAKSGNFIWKPLMRDGGAKLNREVQLYEQTQLLEPRAMYYRSADQDHELPANAQR